MEKNTYYFYVITQILKNNSVNYKKTICYVGKTQDYMKRRNAHKYDNKKRPYNCSSSKVFKLFGFENCELYIFKILECTEQEAIAIEKKYINKFLLSVNKQYKNKPLSN
jgi:predicted GIY-YIG superfamily endonuclease